MRPGKVFSVSVLSSAFSSLMCSAAWPLSSSAPQRGQKAPVPTSLKFFSIDFLLCSAAPIEAFTLYISSLDGRTDLVDWRLIAALPFATFAFCFSIASSYWLIVRSSSAHVAFFVSSNCSMYFWIFLMYSLLSFTWVWRPLFSVNLRRRSDSFIEFRFLTSRAISDRTSMLKIDSISERLSPILIVKNGLLLVTAIPTMYLNSLSLMPRSFSISSWFKRFEDMFSISLPFFERAKTSGL